MIAEQLINYMIPSLKTGDEITRAKQWMDEFRVKQLPVVENQKLLGFISEDLLFDLDIMHASVGEYPLIGKGCFVAPNIHYYDIIQIRSKYEMEMVAVLDYEEFFKGVVLVSDVLNEFANTAIVNAEGAIITLKSRLNDYSLSEISRIVEMNESIILGANVKPVKEDPSLVEVVLRLNHRSVNQIASGLSKSGYTVTSSFHMEDHSFDEKDRYGLLMKYLNP